MELNDLLGRLKDLEAAWRDAAAIMNSRIQHTFQWLEQQVARSGATEGENLRLAAPDALPQSRLIDRVTAETGTRIMALLEKIGPVDDYIRESLRKYCQTKYGVQTLPGLNEAMGRDLIRDLELVIAGAKVMESTEDGAFVLRDA